MDTLSIRFVFDRKGETKKDPKKKALVQIEVFDRVSRRKVYISTGIKILRKQYSENGGFSIKDHPNAVALKGKAHKMFNQIEAYVTSDECARIDDVKNWDRDDSLTLSVVEFIKTDLKRRDMVGEMYLSLQ